MSENIYTSGSYTFDPDSSEIKKGKEVVGTAIVTEGRDREGNISVGYETTLHDDDPHHKTVEAITNLMDSYSDEREDTLREEDEAKKEAQNAPVETPVVSVPEGKADSELTDAQFAAKHNLVLPKINPAHGDKTKKYVDWLIKHRPAKFKELFKVHGDVKESGMMVAGRKCHRTTVVNNNNNRDWRA